jgi:hypothetical protein
LSTKERLEMEDHLRQPSLSPIKMKTSVDSKEMLPQERSIENWTEMLSCLTLSVKRKWLLDWVRIWKVKSFRSLSLSLASPTEE